MSIHEASSGYHGDIQDAVDLASPGDTVLIPAGTYNFIDVDVFVNTACPRVSIDDVGRFNKPIITEKECMVALGKLDWMDLIEKGFF